MEMNPKQAESFLLTLSPRPSAHLFPGRRAQNPRTLSSKNATARPGMSRGGSQETHGRSSGLLVHTGPHDLQADLIVLLESQCPGEEGTVHSETRPILLLRVAHSPWPFTNFCPLTSSIVL